MKKDKKTGFLIHPRQTPKAISPQKRTKNYKEFYKPMSENEVVDQAHRCMDCGVPFCHEGCPLGNLIPDFNDAVYMGDWKLASEILHSTNNFPEFTGRICPAPCESACVLAINKDSVTIEEIEKNIAEKAFEEGYIIPNPPKHRTGKKVAVVGSGPAGLAAADMLNRSGHMVVVYEKYNSLGGLLRYGIPDFKLEKYVIERRIEILKEEGVIFKTGVDVGKDVAVKDILKDYDSVLCATGAWVHRDVDLRGRDLKGVHFAMDYLTQQNKRVSNETFESENILATDKDVIVIGGGDTGSDCIGTANRQMAKSITQLNMYAMPSKRRTKQDPWPLYPNVYRVSSSHQEGCDRKWSIVTKAFVGNENGELVGLRVVKANVHKKPDGTRVIDEIEGTEEVLPCQLALIAIGFTHSEQYIYNQLGVNRNSRGHILIDNYQTNVEKVFAAGDAQLGQSLVVNAIAEGREAARAIDIYLMSASTLEARDKSVYESV